ncbi:MAG: DUF2268 domain-containing putative Zn-dependent protease [Terricaulis sp.]
MSQSLNEGAAEFLAELVSGRIANGHLIDWTMGHELAIEQRFEREMRGRDLSDWLYNGVGTPDAPGDLGYWVGYRIVRAFYERHSDKRRAAFCCWFSCMSLRSPSRSFRWRSSLRSESVVL